MSEGRQPGPFVRVRPIDRGQSGDKKYCVETEEGERMLLRVSDIGQYERKKGEYDMLTRIYGLGVRSPRPCGFGLCDEGRSVYSLSGWLEGEDAQSLMPRMSGAQQYATGRKAGALLRSIHVLPAPAGAVGWGERFAQKVQVRVDLYREHRLDCEQADALIRHLDEHRQLVRHRPQVYWHGDFNVGNHMVMPDGEVGTFDFNIWNLDYGDPWWEFIAMPWGEEPPARYLSGMIDGYFDGCPPAEFFEVLRYYCACDGLSALCYSHLGTEPYTPQQGAQHVRNVLRWFDGLRCTVPTWYAGKTPDAHA